MSRFARVMGLVIVLCAVVGLLWRSDYSLINGRQLPGRQVWAQSDSSSRRTEFQLLNQSVDRDRLRQHVEALSIVRHRERDRLQARQYIVEQLQRAGWIPEEQTFDVRSADSQIRGVNIVATQPGRDSAEDSILLGAHYDTVMGSPGADDNASAVAVVLEVARLLADAPSTHPLTLALFDLEEAGFLGSQAFVNALGRSPDVEAAIILEMIGYACHEAGCQTYPSILPIDPPSDTGDFLAVIGDLGHPFIVNAFRNSVSVLQEVDGVDVPDVFTLSVPTLGGLTPDLFRSDHVPFWRSGRGAVMVTDTANFRNPHYHRESDRPETLDIDFLSGSATIILETIARLIG
ncbi:MAG: M28 family peptidase [Cyanobacteria bacterium J06626_14]